MGADNDRTVCAEWSGVVLYRTALYIEGCTKGVHRSSERKESWIMELWGRGQRLARAPLAGKTKEESKVQALKFR